MTPAIDTAKALKLDYKVHEYQHDSNTPSFGQEAAQKLEVDTAQVFKTLIIAAESKANDHQLAVALLPVDSTLSLKKLAKALGYKKVQLADPKVAERSTGYVLGGVSPLGQKKRLPAVIHQSAQTQATIFVSGGKRGLEIELPPAQLAQAITAGFADIV